MTAARKSALVALRDKVAAGQLDYQFCLIQHTNGIGMNESMWNAYNGSLDAAKALHDAVLPDQSIRMDRRVGGWVVWLDNPHQGINDNPARAWLLAILSALIAEAT